MDQGYTLREQFSENKRQDRTKSSQFSFSSKMLSVSMGCEEVEEVGEEDSSKDIIKEMGSIF